MNIPYSFSFRDVVVVADLLGAPDGESATHARRDLEMTDALTLKILCDAINEVGLKVHHYTSPESLSSHAEKHKEDIVLSIFGGRSSRNRMALVPAVCESFGLRFIGPDVYGRIVAQDKEISKRLAVDCGLKTPAWRVVRTPMELDYVTGFPLPVVVKPLLEGSSIGISQNSRATSSADVRSLAENLLTMFEQPVMIEEFVAGREVAYSRIENGGDDAWAFSEVVIEGQPDFFANRLFDAEEKLNPSPGRTVRNIDHELIDEDHAAIERLLAAFGSYGYCRVDGRLADGRFHFLELTPDAWIAPKGQFARGFTEKGWNYSSVIAAALASVG